MEEVEVLENDRESGTEDLADSDKSAERPSEKAGEESEMRGQLGADDSGEGEEELMKKFRNIFQHKLDEYNKEGFDYLEFRHSLKSMRNITEDEATCFRSIFATAKTLGASRESLIESVDYYREVLLEEEQKFSDTLQKQKVQKLDTLDQQLEQIEEEIQRKKEQIKSLQEEIEEHRSRAEQLRTMIARSDQKISKTRRAFRKTYEEFVEQMESDKEKLKEYLTE